MRFVLIFLIFFSLPAFSQSGKIELYKYSNRNSLVFDYSTLSPNYLTNKHFGLNDSNREDIQKIYKTLNIFQFAPNNKIGEFILNDTIRFDNKISFEEANFAMKSFLSNNVNINFTENKYGFYLFNVILRHRNYSDDLFRVSLKIRNGYIILSANTEIYFYSYHQLIPKEIAYNDKSESFKYGKSEDDNIEQVFINEVAERQIYFYSTIYETREILNYQITQYLNDILINKSSKILK